MHEEVAEDAKIEREMEKRRKKMDKKMKRVGIGAYAIVVLAFVGLWAFGSLCAIAFLGIRELWPEKATQLTVWNSHSFRCESWNETKGTMNLSPAGAEFWQGGYAHIVLLQETRLGSTCLVWHIRTPMPFAEWQRQQAEKQEPGEKPDDKEKETESDNP